jgi:hypothetical protein
VVVPDWLYRVLFVQYVTEMLAISHTDYNSNCLGTYCTDFEY